MSSPARFLASALVFFCVLNSGLLKEIRTSPGLTLPSNWNTAVLAELALLFGAREWQGSGTQYVELLHKAHSSLTADYIHVCKRDPNTIEECVLKSIEALRPQLVAGIPELDVPGLDPFIIPEIKVLSSDNSPIRASGHNVKVTGGKDVIIKSLTVDSDTLTVRAKLRFPKLHFEGNYKLDTQLLVVPLKGEGTLSADAVKCDAEVVFHTQIVQRDGEEYLRFKKLTSDINIKDYKLKLDGLFNGDKTLGAAANEAINQNRGEFLKATKPHLEKTVSKILLDMANKVVDGLTLKQLLPNP